MDLASLEGVEDVRLGSCFESGAPATNYLVGHCLASSQFIQIVVKVRGRIGIEQMRLLDNRGSDGDKVSIAGSVIPEASLTKRVNCASHLAISSLNRNTELLN